MTPRPRRIIYSANPVNESLHSPYVVVREEVDADGNVLETRILGEHATERAARREINRLRETARLAARLVAP